MLPYCCVVFTAAALDPGLEVCDLEAPPIMLATNHHNMEPALQQLTMRMCR